MTHIESADPLAIGLTQAIEAGDTSALARLLSRQSWIPRVGITDPTGVTRSLLHIATDWPGHFPRVEDTIRLLGEAGADPNARVLKAGSDALGETPLHWAASSDDILALDGLLDLGADIDAQGAVLTGGSPMSDAVIFTQWRAARRLVERGAQTTLWQAAALGLKARVASAIKAEPAPTGHEITNGLWHACRGGQRDTAALLLNHGANLNWVGHQQKTPLDVARESLNQGLIEWLIGLGAKAQTTPPRP